VTVICSLHFLTCHIRFVLNQTYPTFVEKYSKYYKTYTLKRWNKGVVLPLETGERDQAFTAVSLVFFCEKDEPKKTRDWLSNWSVARVVMWMEMGMSSCKFSLTFSISVAVRAYLNALLLGHACIMVCDEECPAQQRTIACCRQCKHVAPHQLLSDAAWECMIISGDRIIK
jgi:hypothetical protein